MNSANIPSFEFDNSFAEQLAGYFVFCDPTPVPSPRLLKLNGALAQELNLDEQALNTPQGARIFAGCEVPTGAQPLAQAYAGHQFGGFVPQLGDGRALLLGEVIDQEGRRRDIALKGSGPTPFSRGGDGKAAIGPVLREYVVGEAMHALGVPTTRALAAVATGESVMRESPLPGAVLTRVAASHLRVGTFQFFAAHGDSNQLETLSKYATERHDPDHAADDDRHFLLLKSVAERQAALIAKWMLLGFIHGVMNTDNMAISGETIDYGPCAFMEAYHPNAVFSSIDSGGRYAFGNQPSIAQWNLARFAETLLPLIDETPERAVERATEVITEFPASYESHWLSGMQTKLGLDAAEGIREGDKQLATDFLELLQQHEVDFTLGWRNLTEAAAGKLDQFTSLFPDPSVTEAWLQRWQARRGESSSPDTLVAMRMANPLYIPRNHLVEEALLAATEAEDLSPLEDLLAVVTHPYEELPGKERYAEPALPQFTACYKTFCGT